MLFSLALYELVPSGNGETFSELQVKVGSVPLAEVPHALAYLEKQIGGEMISDDDLDGYRLQRTYVRGGQKFDIVVRALEDRSPVELLRIQMRIGR